MTNQTKTKAKIILVGIFVISIFIMCTGCMMRSKEAVIENITNCIPGIENFEVSNEVFPSGDSGTVYKFFTDEIEFQYCEIEVGMEGGSLTTTKRDTDYYKKVFELKKDDIAQIAQQNGVMILEEKFTKDLMDGTNCCVFIEHSYSGKITFYVYVDNSTNIQRGLDFIGELWKVLDKYVPTQEGLCTQKMHINVYHAKSETLASQQEINMWGDIDLSEARVWAKYEYEADVLDGIIEDNTVNLKNVMPRAINRIYYNDGLLSDLESDKTFYYNPIDGKYYVLVCYGVDKNFDTKHPGYLHKEILETVYPNVSYSIVDSLREKSSTYNINGNEFVIEWSKRDTSKGELIFHKNGTVLDIQTYKSIGPISGQTTANRFISVDDFAKLLDMTAEVTSSAIKFNKTN